MKIDKKIFSELKETIEKIDNSFLVSDKEKGIDLELLKSNFDKVKSIINTTDIDDSEVVQESDNSVSEIKEMLEKMQQEMSVYKELKNFLVSKKIENKESPKVDSELIKSLYNNTKNRR